MTTPELRTSGAGGEVPASADELSRLASQIYAHLTPLQVASPAAPPTAPVAPRGSAPDATAVTSLARPVGEAGAQLAPVTPVNLPWQEPNLAGVLPGLDSPPYTVPVAPRGSALDATGATSLARPAVEAGAQLAPATPAVPAAAAGQPWLEPNLAGVLPGADSPPYTVPVAPRGSAPGTSAVAQAGPGEPVIPAAPAAPLSQGERIPKLDLTALLRPWGAPVEPRSVTTAPVTSAPVREAEFAGARPGGAADRKLAGQPEQYDVHTVRGDFPILAEEVNGHPLIWFDNAATTQKPQAVIDRLAYFYTHENSNIHRAAHELAARATDAYEDARDTVRRFLGAPRSENIACWK